MDQADLKYELRINQNAWFIRFFVWLYEPDSAYDVSFCALFWAYVFAVPVLLLKCLVIEPLLWLMDVTEPRRKERRLKMEAQSLALKLEGRTPEPKWAMRFLYGVGNVASKLIFAIGSVWSVASRHRRANKVAVWTVWIVGALVGIAACTVIVVIFINDFGVTKFILLGGCALVLAVLAMLALYQIGFKEKILDPLGHGVRLGALGFRDTMRTGFYAVKTNTCPRVTLVRDDTRTPPPIVSDHKSAAK